MNAPADAAGTLDPADRDYRTGPKLDAQAMDRMAGLRRAGTQSPTWRGWVIGLLCVAFLSLSTPYIEMVLNGSLLTMNLLPVGPMILLLMLLIVQTALHAMAPRLGLSREDMTLATCMAMVSASLSGYGYVTYLTGAMSGMAHARAENRWNEYVMPYLKDWMVPHDPIDKNSADPRPIEWFLNSVPQGREAPWSAWMVPYAYWALMALCVFGMMFAVCSILRKQWADRERLPFPLEQVPLEMIEGMPGTLEKRRPFLRDPMALLGMAIPFTLHSWNSLSSYVSNWPEIPLRFRYLNIKYLSEPPWKALGPLHVYIFPAVIGLTYLISLEVSFSIWFFYLMMKICAFAAVQMGLGSSHEDFYDVGGHKGFMIDQGGGALVSMVLFGLWMSRTHLADTFLRGIGLRPMDEEDDDGLSPRTALLLFTVSFIGAVIWLVAAGMGLGFALLIVVSLMIIVTGVTRLACEGGLFYVQSQISPEEILNVAFTPMGLGPHTIVPLGMWSRIFVFDWGRTSPMPSMMHALKLSSDLKVRKKPIVVGMAISLVLALTLGFYSFMSMAFKIGARQFEGGSSWTMNTLPEDDFKRSANKVAQILAYDSAYDKNFAEIAVAQNALSKENAERELAEASKLRKEGLRARLPDLLVEKNLMTPEKAREIERGNVIVPDSQLPASAVYDFKRIFWLFLGGVLMIVFMLLRTRIFWWPHPIGYVTWMHPAPMEKLWFPIFVGWFLKWAITQYGGFRVYMLLRRTFIGLVVGEMAAAGFWIVVAWATGSKGAYPIHIN
ncbi:MAG: hypothetical protein KIS92_08810 [Planctomycetota bacterium]|nr:hypothetical protein [Planctomycetota bacterium]